ncbi:NAD(P)H-binding protein [Nonomuraea sp. NPDC004297]
MILVAGASGNVGADIVNQLVAAGERVRVLTRDPARHRLPDQVEVVTGDLTRPQTLPGALTGVDRAFLFPLHDAIDGFLEAAGQVGLDVTDRAAVFESVRRARERSGRPARPRRRSGGSGRGRRRTRA